MAKRAKKAAVADDAQPTLTKPSDIESSPAGVVKRWLAELNVADTTEKTWREEGEAIWKRYEAEEASDASFPILWSNTEILAASVYNSTPQPDVRRRFRDADPVGKAVSTVLERSLSYEVDDYDFDDELSDAVLDMLLPGRGIVRIKYEPKFIEINAEGARPGAPAGAFVPPVPNAEPAAVASGHEPPASEPSAAPVAPMPDGQAAQPSRERLVDQHVPCCHVQWDKFRRGHGKRWKDVPWISFEHEFTMEMAEEKFGTDIASKLTYSQGAETEKASEDRQVREIFKVAVVHEIWDKDRERVLFIAPGYKEAPCLVVDDPLKLKGFWPMPKPAYAIRNSRKLEPTPLYRLYKQQALALERISFRINKIVEALKLRGAYAANLPELAKILDSDDTDMTAVESSAEVAAAGGLDKAIWIMPIEKLAQVLQQLYTAREQQKQTIYEIIGIGDILRGASDPNETAKAQQIKSQWGSIRVQKMQKEVQRMARDLIRLKAEVIAQQFTPERLAAITNLQLPTNQQKEAAKQSAAQAQMAGQPPDPQVAQLLSTPSWEDVMQVLRSDQLRCYKVDVETDSTVAETINRDMTGLAEVMASVAQVLGGIAQGLPVEVAKEVSLAIVRRARLGSAVEDALENFQPPPPQAPDAGQQLEATKQQILDLIKSEGEKQVREKDAVAEQQAGLQEYDQQIQQTLGSVGEVAQAGAQQIQQAGQVAQANNQLLSQLAPVLQQLAQTSQALQQQMAQVGQTMQAIIQAIQSPPPRGRRA
jgi:hypothetical protein